MIDKNKIKEMTNHILHPQKNKNIDHKIMHVEREWFFGIFLGATVVVVGAIWSWSTYQEYRTVDTTKSGVMGESVIYREELVEEVLKDFEQREEVYEALMIEAKDKVSVMPMATTSLETNVSESEVKNKDDVPETDYVNPVIDDGQNPANPNGEDLDLQ